MGLPSGMNIVDEFHKQFYESHVWQRTYWLGVPTLKYPNDLILYQEIIHKVRPDLIIECGTYVGGTSLFLASICELIGSGRVLSIDCHDDLTHRRPSHDRIEYFKGSSTGPDTILYVQQLALLNKVILVILDSDHSYNHVLTEMTLYAPFVSEKSYLIVEDTNVNGHPVFPDHGPGPWEAVESFLPTHPEFTVDVDCEKLLVTANPNGYLFKSSIKETI